MSDNHRLIKDVSNALRYYIDIRRREEAFDLSGTYNPPYDLNKYKFSPLFGYNGVYDKQIQHSFPKSNFKKIFTEESSRREKHFRDEIVYHLKKGNERKKKFSRALSSKPHANEEATETKLIRSRSKSATKTLRPASAYIPLGLLSVRSKPTPYLTKGEKKRVIQTTSVILSATDEIFQKDPKKRSSKKIIYPTQTQKENTETTVLSPKNKENEKYLEEYLRAKAEQDREEENERIDVSATQTQTKSSGPEAESYESKQRSTKSKRKKSEIAKTQTEGIQNVEELELLNAVEVVSGQKIKYRITVKTGEKPGSGTEAKIKLKLFGDKYQDNIKATKWIDLENSLTYKLPFQRGNEDVFEIQIYDIGKLRAITIGHVESEIKYSWFLEDVKIYEPVNDINYEFVFNKWFSHSTEDKKNIRTAFVNSANFVPKGEQPTTGVMKNYVLTQIHEPDHHKVPNVKKIEVEQNYDEKLNDFQFAENLYQARKSLTTSVKAHASSSSSTSRRSSQSSESSKKPDVQGKFVDSASSSGTSSKESNRPQDRLAADSPRSSTTSSSTTPRIKETRNYQRRYSTTSSSSSSTVEIDKSKIEVEYIKRLSSAASSKSGSVKKEPIEEPKKQHSRKSSTSSSSSSTTLKSEENAGAIQGRFAKSPSSSDTLSDKQGKFQEAPNKTEIIVQRRNSTSSSSSSSSSSTSSDSSSSTSSSSSSSSSNTQKKHKPAEVIIRANSASNSSVSQDDKFYKLDLARKPPSSASSKSSIDQGRKSGSLNRSTQKLSPDIEEDNNEKSKLAFKLLSENDLEALKDLISNNSKIVLSKNSNGENLLAVACQQQHNRIVRFLVENDDILISTDTQTGHYPIHYCAKYDNLEALKILFENGALLDTQTNEGLTALHVAAMRGYLDICRYLVSKNADIDIQDDLKRTAYDIAIANNQGEVADYLSECKEKKSSSSNGNGRDSKVFETQQSVMSSINERDLFANIERNEKPVLESPLVRPHRPSPKVYSRIDSKSEESESETENTAQEKSNQQSSANEYTTIVQTNQNNYLKTKNNIISNRRDSESSDDSTIINNDNSKSSSSVIQKPKKLITDESSSDIMTPKKKKNIESDSDTN